MSENETAPTTELARYEGPEYLVMKRDPQELRELFEENMDDADEFDLDSISVPGGGALTWSVPDLNGEPMSKEELQGVVILKGARRAYWEHSFDETGGGSPPDCSSLDAKTGTGYIPGDDRNGPPKTRSCDTCPMAQWGSKHPEDPKDNQQACSRRTLLFLVGPKDVIPQKVDLAPTSVKPFRQFMSRLTKANVRRTQAVVGLRLANDRSRTGIKYSVVAPRLVGALNEDQGRVMKALGQALEPHFKRTGINTPPPDVVDQDRAEARAQAQAHREREEAASAPDTEAERQRVDSAEADGEKLFSKEPA